MQEKSKWYRRVPGFRSGSKWKAIVASVFYFFLFIGIVGAIFGDDTSTTLEETTSEQEAIEAEEAEAEAEEEAKQEEEERKAQEEKEQATEEQKEAEKQADKKEEEKQKAKEEKEREEVKAKEQEEAEKKAAKEKEKATLENCSDFEDGQQVYDHWVDNEFNSENDPNNLDAEGSGLPCEILTEDMEEDFAAYEKEQTGKDVLSTASAKKEQEAEEQAAKEEEKAKEQAAKEKKQTKKENEKKKQKAKKEEKNDPKKTARDIAEREVEVINVEYYEDTNHVNVYYELADNFTKGMTLSSSHMSVASMLENFEETNIGSVYFEAETTFTDQYGEESQDQAITYDFSKETIDQINYANFDYDNLPSVADSYWEHPDFSR